MPNREIMLKKWSFAARVQPAMTLLCMGLFLENRIAGLRQGHATERATTQTRSPAPDPPPRVPRLRQSRRATRRDPMARWVRCLFPAPNSGRSQAGLSAIGT
jgi:hypothetical protein